MFGNGVIPVILRNHAVVGSFLQSSATYVPIGKSKNIPDAQALGIFTLGLSATIPTNTPKMALKLFLENVDANTGLMTTDLQAIPNFSITDPYLSNQFVNNPRFAANGYQAQSPTPIIATVNNLTDVVDWVLVRLQHQLGWGTYTRALLLKKDGTVVDPNGNANFTVSPNMPTGVYTLTVVHRNHLGFTTGNQSFFTGQTKNFDFTNASHPAIRGAYGLRNKGNGIYVLCGGDADSDGSVDAFDSIIWDLQNGLFNDYEYNADYNLDGGVDAFDTIVWEINNGKFDDIDY
jgi:hypothetical protein